MNENLKPSGLDENPIVEFGKWYFEAIKDKSIDAAAMTLATVASEGKPSARVVLLKDFSEKGFVFYTNYKSRKAKELLTHPAAALVFYWFPLYRQVRIEGSVVQMSAEENKTYFASRPRESQLGALASPQSEEVAGRDFLYAAYSQVEKKYDGQEIPCPDFWGGFRIVPETIEFWIGQPKRLHDRVLYFREGSLWRRKFLAP